MNRLIDADKLLEKTQVLFDEDGDYVDAVSEEDIEEAQTVDATPVVHAHWTEHKNAEEIYGMLISNYECSNCHEWVQDDWPFCPRCGAKMDEVE